MLRRLILTFLISLGLGAIAAAAPDAIRITKWEPMGGPPAPAYIHLEVELPCDLQDFKEEFTVNGRPAPFSHQGTYSGSMGCGRDYALYVGAPGKKEITVTVTADGRRYQAATSLEFRSNGAMVLLDRTGREALEEPGEWRFWVYFVRDIKVWVNGAPQAFQRTPTAISPDHALVSFRPELKPGVNSIKLEGRDSAGEAIAQEYRPYFLKERQVKLHDEILWPYGYLGSKSGPFFRLEVEGEALKAAGRVEAEQAGLKDQAWYFQKRIFLGKLQAQKPGEATIKVYKKSWFTNPYELSSSFPLKVIP